MAAKKEKKISETKRILMERDNLSSAEADKLISECRQALLEGDNDAIMYYLGLEDDYIFDIL